MISRPTIKLTRVTKPAPVKRPTIYFRKPAPAPTVTRTQLCRCGSVHTLNDVTPVSCPAYGGMSIILVTQL